MHLHVSTTTRRPNGLSCDNHDLSLSKYLMKPEPHQEKKINNLTHFPEWGQQLVCGKPRVFFLI
jgi:hypothetical protein